MRYREIIEAIENNDDEMFGSRGTSYAGWSAEDIKERYDELWEELYGYEAYWPDDEDNDEVETHSPKFKEKEQELDNLLHYVRIHWGEGFYNHLYRPVAARRNHDHSDREQRPEPPKDAFHDMRYRGDPRITKTGKLHKQDQQVLAKMVKSRVGTHRTPVLPESNDDELFGSAPSANSLTQSIARAIVRSDKSARLITSPFMVGFALGKTPGGEHLLQYWKSIGQEKQDAMLDGINDAVYDLIANKVTEDDDDMFGSSTRPDSKVIAQDLELWLRRRQSSSRRPIIPSSENYVKQVIAAFNQNFLKGVETWREYPLYGNTDIKYDIREYLENSLNVNLMDYVDQVNENDESDDELFGDGKQKVYVVTAPDDEILGMFDDVREAIAQAKKQVPIYLEDGWADDDLITVYKQNWGEESGVPVAHFPITDDPIDENDESDEDLFAAPTIRFGDFFNEYDEDQLQALGFSYGDDPEQDVDIINHYLEDGPVSWRVLKLTDASGQGDNIVLHLNRSSRLGEEESDNEMFGTSAGAGQRMIYTYGKQLLHKLEQAYNNPQIKQKYLKVTQDDEDGDEPFRLVLQATGAEFGKAFVVDTIVREFAGGMEGLNDFGWMIDDGIFDELTNGWEEFGRSTDVANEDWFRKELQTFMGDR